MSDTQQQSDIPEFKIPEFKPLIPEYMLKGIKDESTQYIIEQLSIMSQQGSWQTHKIMNIHNYTKNINGKVIELEQWRNDIIKEIQIQEEKEKVERKASKQVEIKEKGHKKYYKWGLIIFLAILYPLYLALVDESGLSSIFKTLTLFQ